MDQSRHDQAFVDAVPAVYERLLVPLIFVDAVVCQFGVMFFPGKPRTHAEVHRVLRRPGHVL